MPPKFRQPNFKPPDRNFSKPNIDPKKAKYLPPKSKAPVANTASTEIVPSLNESNNSDYPSQAVVAYQEPTGVDLHSFKPVDRLQGIYIIGKHGFGKSTLIEHLIVNDMIQGMGLCLLDPHGDLTDDVLAKVPSQREKDVILLDLMDTEYPFGLNIFECADVRSAKELQATYSLVMHLFEKLWDISRSTPLMAQILRNCTYTLIENPGTTMAEIPLLLRNADARKKLVNNVTNPFVRDFWTEFYNKISLDKQREYSEHIINKIEELLQSPLLRNIVGQSHSTINFRRIMDDGKILLVKLSPQHETLTELIGSIIVGQILLAAYSRIDTLRDKRRQFHLYADEFQRFATRDFATLLTEARKFKIATTIAHQHRGQLNERNKDAALSAATLVFFQLTGSDARELVRELDIRPRPAEEVIEEDPYQRSEEITTYVLDVVGYLLSSNKGSHPIPLVNTFALTTLKRLAHFSGDGIKHSGLSSLLYEAMVGKETAQPFPKEVVQQVLFTAVEQLGVPLKTLAPLVDAVAREDWYAAQREIENILTTIKNELGNSQLIADEFQWIREEIEAFRADEDYYRYLVATNAAQDIYGITDWKQAYREQVLKPDNGFWNSLPLNPESLQWVKEEGAGYADIWQKTE